MEYIRENGVHVLLADAKWVDDTLGAVTDVKLGMLASDLQMYGQRGLGTAIAQLYQLVSPGLILTRHVFKGLVRGLYCDGSASADEDKLVYTRKPSSDYVWNGSGADGAPSKRPPPPGKVFAVVISPNIRHREIYPSVTGWINRWNWVDEDPALAEAPIDWLDRYDKKLWTRK